MPAACPNCSAGGNVGHVSVCCATPSSFRKSRSALQCFLSVHALVVNQSAWRSRGPGAGGSREIRFTVGRLSGAGRREVAGDPTGRARASRAVGGSLPAAPGGVGDPWSVRCGRPRGTPCAGASGPVRRRRCRAGTAPSSAWLVGESPYAPAPMPARPLLVPRARRSRLLRARPPGPPYRARPGSSGDPVPAPGLGQCGSSDCVRKLGRVMFQRHGRVGVKCALGAAMERLVGLRLTRDLAQRQECNCRLTLPAS